MNKRIFAALALVSAAAVGGESPAMEHVLVTVPLHKKTSETALPVTVLSGEALQRAAGSTIGDTLALQPGLNNASFGPGVGQPVIRGQQGARVTVLQNGTVSADASNLSADHAVAVESILADSIEVLRGPATLLYGGGAIGGVVNVTDGRIPPRLVEGAETQAEFRYDSASQASTGVVRSDASQGDYAFHLDSVVRHWGDLSVPKNTALAHDEHDDHATSDEPEGPPSRLANTDGEITIVTLGASRHFDSGFFGVAIQNQQSEYGIPAAAHAHEVDPLNANPEPENPEQGIRIDLDQSRYDLALHLHDPYCGIEEARAFIAYTDYQHAEIEPDGAIGTVYRNESTQLRLEAVHETVGMWHGVVGVQLGQSQFSALGDEAFIPVTDKDQLGVFIVEDLHMEQSVVELGLRYDRDERSPAHQAATARAFDSLSASASWVHDLDDGWQWSLAVARAERAPAIEELYSNTGLNAPEEWIVHAATEAIELGSSELDTEVSNNLDVSLSRSWGGHYVEVVAYYNRFKDYIGLLNSGQLVGDVSVYRYEQTDATFHGLEISSTWALGELYRGDAELTINSDISRGKLEAPLGNIPRMPANRVFAQFDWRGNDVYVWARAVHSFKQSQTALNEEPTSAFTKIDLGLEWVLPNAQDWTVFVSAHNLTDAEIRLHTSFLKEIAPEPGRGLEIGIRGQF